MGQLIDFPYTCSSYNNRHLCLSGLSDGVNTGSVTKDPAVETNLMGRKILVTGACGFIGSHLAERLVTAGAEVRAFVRYDSLNSFGNIRFWPTRIRREVEIIHGDLKDSYAVLKAVRGMDIVLHLGALISIPYSYQNPMDFVQTNVVGTTHVLEASLENEVGHVVITSSSEVYGTAQELPICEDHPMVGQSPYAASKIAAEKVAESFCHSYGLPLTIVRPFNTFGPRQSARAIVPSVISQALFRRRIAVGSLEPRRDFNYVGDIVEGFVKACQLDRPEGQVYNLGTGASRSMKDTVDRILNVLELECPIEEEFHRFRPDESEIWCLEASAEKAKNDLGWQSTHEFDQGVLETANFIRVHPEVYNQSEYPV